MDFSNILTLAVIVICAFAIFDLIVWVSNDAINFLSPAVGSKAAGYRTVIIIAAFGLLLGTLFGSGLMEVARKGIFHPQYFSYSEIVALFLTVMIGDILLLNKFNSWGMPTSTTVSIVFGLLGAAVGMWTIKVVQAWAGIETLATYINTAKVLSIVIGILGSVLVAFFLGSIVQYITRIFFTFEYDLKPKYWSSILGAIAITAITHFMMVKGLKGSQIPEIINIREFINSNTVFFIGAAMFFWFLVMQFALIFKANIFKLVVLIGTFSLAMAFAGNDLVNFIGVPIAALSSYGLFEASGSTNPATFMMDGLAGKVEVSKLLLLGSGVLMVITLVTSKKAKRVLNTGLNLSRQGQNEHEKFHKSFIAEIIVKDSGKLIWFVAKHTPMRIAQFVWGRFQSISESKKSDGAFDLVRASVILICSSIVLSVATTYKLPLSTTYVTFMVGMGAAFADRAWGRESAVERVNGVIHVIFGWFMTAIGGFTLAFIIANIIYFGWIVGKALMVGITCYVMMKPLIPRLKRFGEKDEA